MTLNLAETSVVKSRPSVAYGANFFYSSSYGDNNNRDDIYGAVIMAKPLREFTGSFDEYAD